LAFLASFMAFITRYIVINATAMIKAAKIVHKEEDRIKADFPHHRVNAFAKGFAGQPLTGATFAK
jgi:hypothetical protein